MFYEEKFKELGVKVYISTVDGSYGKKGFVTDIINDLNGYTYYYACGPKNMLKAVYDQIEVNGELSFEERMGCGFGACMGCTCQTNNGPKRICKNGPVLRKKEIIW
ncbi:Dihydroorotate dehydrogenase B (NAD(+)), electron transfer subunit [compost metagenome]